MVKTYIGEEIEKHMPDVNGLPDVNNLPKGIKLTMQQAFEIMVTGLLRQGVKSGYLDEMDSRFFNCKYRGWEGTKCAIGFIIPDDIYDTKYEGSSVSQIHSLLPLEMIYDNGHANFEMERFLDDMQDIHDDSEIETWFAHFVTVGRTYHLDMNFMDALK